MKYSAKWIQEHLDTPLPPVDELVHTITIKSFEVEGVEKVEDDTVLEMKVLPDRAHDALSHRGMAREISALFGLPKKEREIADMKTDSAVAKVSVEIEDARICPRYISVRVDNVKVGTSPKWLSAKIASVGGRSINNIVDLTNFVLFDIGQPMHAFDREKVVGGITVRLAEAGKTMTTLDGKDLTFDGTELVIADDEGVLALAGVKGGKKAEVDGNTTSIIFESANFDPTLTRRTGAKHGIKTDASKRYENGMTSEFALEGMQLILSELVKIQPDVKIGEMTDVYSSPEKGGYQMKISVAQINHLLGSSMPSMSRAALGEVLGRIGFAYNIDGEEYQITIPSERLDLRIRQDLIEEIGRHHGYDKIEGVVPQFSRKGIPHKRLYYANKVRKFLIGRGYSEVYTYSFARKGGGVVEVLNPVGQDRPFMREQLNMGLKESLQQNAYFAPLMGLSDVRIFELGNVFEMGGEHMLCAVGVLALDKKQWKGLEGFAEMSMRDACKELGVNDPSIQIFKTPQIYEEIIKIDFDALIKDLSEPTEYEELKREKNEISYQTLSSYPFIVRDIAIFVPQEVTEEYIETLLQKEAGELLVRFSQFDKFQKPGEERISYGYRMVFQSFDRTLTDEEINKIMEHITARCNTEKDWQVR